MEHVKIHDETIVESLLVTLQLTKKELCSLNIRSLNKKMNAITVKDKQLLMKTRRKLKNIDSAKKTRQKAIEDHKQMEQEVRASEDMIHRLKEKTRLLDIKRERQLKALQLDWQNKTSLWAEEIGCLTEMAFSIVKGQQQGDVMIQINRLISELDFLSKKMKKSACQGPNLNDNCTFLPQCDEPLNLSQQHLVNLNDTCTFLPQCDDEPLDLSQQHHV